MTGGVFSNNWKKTLLIISIFNPILQDLFALKIETTSLIISILTLYYRRCLLLKLKQHHFSIFNPIWQEVFALIIEKTLFIISRNIIMHNIRVYMYIDQQNPIDFTTAKGTRWERIIDLFSRSSGAFFVRIHKIAWHKTFENLPVWGQVSFTCQHK